MNNNEFKKIADYVMPEMDIFPSDMAILFGTRHGVKEFCDETLALWNKNLFQRLLISGGCTLGIEKSEAEIIKSELVLMGMPEDKIILEDKSTNTGENVIFSKMVVEKKIGKDVIKSVLGIGKISSSRRYLMTLERHWPEVSKSIYPINYFSVSRNDWHTHEEFRRRVLLEWEKIPGYIEKGFLAEVKIQDFP
ncbi:MAG: YdcF family protein [Bacteriovoracaceae bacterium]